MAYSLTYLWMNCWRPHKFFVEWGAVWPEEHYEASWHLLSLFSEQIPAETCVFDQGAAWTSIIHPPDNNLCSIRSVSFRVTLTFKIMLTFKNSITCYLTAACSLQGVQLLPSMNKTSLRFPHFLFPPVTVLPVIARASSLHGKLSTKHSCILWDS